MKKIFCICLSLFCMIVALSSCREVVNSNSETVKGVVVDTYYHKAWSQIIPHRAGKITTYTMINHPARYEITVRYEDIKETFNNKEQYDKYVDNIGGTIELILVTTTYDDNSISYKLCLSEEKK